MMGTACTPEIPGSVHAVVLQRPRTLPWRKALTNKRLAEEVRPIHWSNRPKAYLSRTADWDSFPAGAALLGS